MGVMGHRAKIVACACHKGGVGKTTTAASLGGLIALSEGQRVLLVDADPQMNLTTTFTDGVFDRTLYTAFTEYRAARSADLPVFGVRDNLDIVPAAIDLCAVDSDFASVPGRDLMLRKMLQPLREQYDWIFVDCPAQLGALTVNALVAADYAIIPLSCDAYSADGLVQIRNFISIVKDVNEDLSILGVLVTKYRARRVVDQLVTGQLDAGWNRLVFKTRIRENSAIVKAPLRKQDVYMYDSRSAGAQDYASLLGEIRMKIQQPKKKRKHAKR